MTPPGSLNRSATRLLRAARPLAGAALSAVLPARCLGCGVIVGQPRTLCMECWSAVTFLGPPWCECCGLPFEHDHGPGMICLACHQSAPLFARARAAMRYDDHVRGLILKLKHADRTEGVAAYGRWMTRAAPDLVDQADLIAPVPLHWTRLLNRRYNQSALLARSIAAAAGRPHGPTVLARRKQTQPLGHLSPARRRQILRGAFETPARSRAALRDKRVLLIDDVLTTGATVTACTRALLRGGADAVDVLTLARVARGLP